MANIFKEQKAVNEHPKRNNFDLSKKSNVSLKFGTLYPVYCQPVIPGDSFSIETAFNLKLLPVVFPVQTKMRAHMHFFYVRNKNLWSNWENWISNLVGQSEHPHPYISVPDSEFKNGSIHDFLGVPTTVITDGDISVDLGFPTFEDDERFDVMLDSATGFTSTSILNNNLVHGNDFFADGTSFSSDTPLAMFQGSANLLSFDTVSYGQPFNLNISNLSQLGGSSPFVGYVAVELQVKNGHNVFPQFIAYIPINYNSQTNNYYIIFPLSLEEKVAEYKADHPTYEVQGFNLSLLLKYSSAPAFDEGGSMIFTDKKVTFYAVVASKDFIEYSNLSLPLYSRYLHINALPYRAYESIYYCYYNNNVLNPLKINGVTQYNRYNTNLDDGADSTRYHLFQRNYELDFLTSSLPSPQQGVAPLVGMTALGDITIEDENGITTAHADIDNDGTITKVVLTSPAASNEHARVAMNMASCGMSINDFRQTNALQRMLETNIRKGYRYMDFIAGHFGKEPEYRELDLPEFIGGFSRDVTVSTVVSNADTLGADSGAALGEYGGYAQVIGGSNHAVRHYCDDFGYIIGILSVVPTPCYSQLLPKHMIAPDNFLDYPFPEFMQSGLMPITYKEVAPIQSFIDGIVDSDKRLEDTFGYQRPNYDLVSAVDEVHGEFRGSLRDYVINRIFDTRPELGQDFISINPEEINDIFVNRNPDEDTIIGEIGFSVHAKRPVPRVVIPNLGR